MPKNENRKRGDLIILENNLNNFPSFPEYVKVRVETK